jgi:hypothetical protein
VKLTQTETFTYDGDSDHREIGTTLAYDDETGNLTEKIEYGEVSGSDNGTFSDTGTDKRTTTITYAASTTPHILGLPSRELVQNQASSTIKDTKHYYDTLSLGNVNVGNETKTEFWKASSNYASTTKTYNSYGLPTAETDGLGNSTYTYDSENLYIATSTNTLSQTTGYQYDYSLGKPKSVIDANSRVFQTVYDGLDRPVTEKQPDQTTPSTLVTKKHTHTPTPLPISLSTRISTAWTVPCRREGKPKRQISMPFAISSITITVSLNENHCHISRRDPLAPLLSRRVRCIPGMRMTRLAVLRQLRTPSGRPPKPTTTGPPRSPTQTATSKS